MKTLLTPTPLIAIEIPNSYSNFYMDGSLIMSKANSEVIDSFVVGLSPYDKTVILGTVDKGVIDFDVTEYLIDRIDIDNSNYDNAYFHFGDNKTTGWSAANCFLSLLESHSLSLDKKYLIIKPKN